MMASKSGGGGGGRIGLGRSGRIAQLRAELADIKQRTTNLRKINRQLDRIIRQNTR